MKPSSPLFRVDRPYAGLCAFGVLVSTLSLTPLGRAATYTWNGSTGTGFETVGDWTSSTGTTTAVPANSLATDIALFSLDPTTIANQPQITVSRSINGLSFTNATGGGYTLGSSSASNVLGVGGSGISTVGQASGTTDTISANLSVGATQTWAAGVGTTLKITGNLGYSGTDVLSFGTTGNTGMVVLAGSGNTFAGTMNFNFGTVQLGTGSALSSSTTIAIGGNATGTFDLNGNNVSVGNFGGNANIVNNASSTAVTLTIAPSAINTFSGVLADNSGTGGTLALYKAGTSDEYIYGANNTYSGGTTITSGTVRSDHNNGLGSGAVTMAGSSGTNATLLLLSVSGSYSGNFGNAIVVNGTNNFIYTNVGTTLTGAFTGSGTLTFSGNLGTTLSGNTSAFAGTIDIDNGTSAGHTVSLTNATASGSQLANWEIATTAGTQTGNALQYSGVAGTAAAPNPYTVPLGSLSGGANGVLQTGTANTVNTYQIGYLDANTTYAGTIVNGTGTTALQVTGNAGTGSLTLTGNNTFTGASTVSKGTLIAAGNGALGSGTAGTASITVNSGGTLALSGATTAGTTPGGVFDRIKNTAPISLGTMGATGTGGIISLSGGGPILEGTAVSLNGTATTASPFRTGSTTSVVGLGILSLTSNSTLNYNGQIGTLVFSGFTPGAFTLNITGYTNTTENGSTLSGVDGTDDRLVFNSDQSANILAGAFKFNGSSANVGEVQLDTGYFEIVPIPEPASTATIAGAMALLAAGWLRRRVCRA